MTDSQATAHKAVLLDSQSFEKTLNNPEKLPVFVDFYADWCGPCKAAAPIIEKLAGEYQGKVIIAKLDTDESHDLAIKNRVMSIPTVIVYKDGQEVDRQIGFPGESGYRRMLAKVAE